MRKCEQKAEILLKTEAGADLKFEMALVQQLTSAQTWRIWAVRHKIMPTTYKTITRRFLRVL